MGLKRTKDIPTDNRWVIKTPVFSSFKQQLLLVIITRKGVLSEQESVSSVADLLLVGSQQLIKLK